MWAKFTKHENNIVRGQYHAARMQPRVKRAMDASPCSPHPAPAHQRGHPIEPQLCAQAAVATIACQGSAANSPAAGMAAPRPLMQAAPTRLIAAFAITGVLRFGHSATAVTARQVAVADAPATALHELGSTQNSVCSRTVPTFTGPRSAL